MGYKIMSRDLKGTSLSGNSALEYYENNRALHLDPKKVTYGDVLVQTKRVFVGVNIKFRFYFRNHWYWTPRYYFKYGDNYFHWLFFMLWFNKEYSDVFDKIIKDHLTESKINNK